MGMPIDISGFDGNAMAAWKERQANRPKFMQCAYCGSGAYEGERCEGCGSRQFLRYMPDTISQAVPSVLRVKRSHPK